MNNSVASGKILLRLIGLLSNKVNDLKDSSLKPDVDVYMESDCEFLEESIDLERDPIEFGFYMCTSTYNIFLKSLSNLNILCLVATVPMIIIICFCVLISGFVHVGTFILETMIPFILQCIRIDITHIYEQFVIIFGMDAFFWIGYVWACFQILWEMFGIVIDKSLYSLVTVTSITYNLTKTEIIQIRESIAKQIEKLDFRLNSLVVGSLSHTCVLEQMNRLSVRIKNLDTFLSQKQFSTCSFSTIPRRFRYKFSHINFPSSERKLNPAQEIYLRNKYSNRNVHIEHQQRIDRVYENVSNIRLEMILSSLNSLLNDVTNTNITHGKVLKIFF